MISLESKGSWGSTEAMLKKMAQGTAIKTVLDRAGSEGVTALKAATPVDTANTANSWYYEVSTKGGYSVAWYNSSMAGGTSVAILLQYGHGTGTGGYVAGRDYINPALEPIFDRIANDVWEAVKNG